LALEGDDRFSIAAIASLKFDSVILNIRPWLVAANFALIGKLNLQMHSICECLGFECFNETFWESFGSSPSPIHITRESPL
jgi:hypothetical protein